MQRFGYRTSEGNFILYYIVELDQNDANTLPQAWEVPEWLHDVVELRGEPFGIGPLKGRNVRVVAINFGLNHPCVLWDHFDPTLDESDQSDTDEIQNEMSRDFPYIIRLFFPRFARQVAEKLYKLTIQVASLQKVIAKLRK
jgi:hypothetical protein